MMAYIVRRVWQMIPTLLGVILLVFVIFNMVGGDPAYVLAGKISMTANVNTIYLPALKSNPTVANGMNHALPPKGPGRRFG